MSYMDVRWGGSGFLRGDRLARVLNHYLGDVKIEALDRKFAAVACDLRTGYEVWLQHGSRALGAHIVIAISLNGDAFGPIGSSHEMQFDTDADPEPTIDPFELASQSLNKLRPDRLLLKSMMGPAKKSDGMPKMGAVMMGTLNIIMDRISRSRLAGDPPDVFVAPRIGHIGMLEFTKADELIERGYRAMQHEIPLIKSVIDVLNQLPSQQATSVNQGYDE